MYDDMLKIKLPPGAEIVAFADDVGLVITGNTLEEIQRIFGECYEAVQRWMGSVGLKLAEHKTEAVLFHHPRGGDVHHHVSALYWVSRSDAGCKTQLQAPCRARCSQSS